MANTAAAVRAGFHGVHVTVNGLGERAGNAPLSSAVAVLHDRLGRTTGIDETKINRVSRTVESYTGIRIPANRPIVGATATARTTSTSTNCFPSVSGASANTPWAKPRARPMS